ncbi:hypothetical protein VNO78_00683 [Psophocarpus tetragonolobus]|uniref:Uncharacterized protein n=1 Tax=Psophocarpus tetragonolobus TaxID=3891 RepID=A0AAN9SYQ9_PSOTE
MAFNLMQDTTPSTDTLTLKLDEILSDTDYDVGQFCFNEETIENLMQELSKEITASPTPTPPPSPSNVPLLQPQNDSVVGLDKLDEADFDDEWLARVLASASASGHGQFIDTTDWF